MPKLGIGGTERWLHPRHPGDGAGLGAADPDLPDLAQPVRPAERELGQHHLRGRPAGRTDRRRHRHLVHGRRLGRAISYRADALQRSAAAIGRSDSSWPGIFGTLLGCVNAFFIYQFRIVSIVVTIATYNLFFGLLMFFSGGVSTLRPARLVDDAGRDLQRRSRQAAAPS